MGDPECHRALDKVPPPPPPESGDYPRRIYSDTLMCSRCIPLQEVTAKILGGRGERRARRLLFSWESLSLIMLKAVFHVPYSSHFHICKETLFSCVCSQCKF